eukprot:870105-Pleurochrysis_carterae.AAC.1
MACARRSSPHGHAEQLRHGAHPRASSSAACCLRPPRRWPLQRATTRLSSFPAASVQPRASPPRTASA